jgi:PQQ-like domain
MLNSRGTGWLKRWIFLGVLGALSLLSATTTARSQIGIGLISQQQAHRGGMQRAWFARAEVNPARSEVVRWILSGDQLLVVTNAGIIQALDANTGQSLWVTSVGNPDYPSLGPGTNEKYAALVNGSTLFVLDRSNGRILSERQVGGAPGAGPALSKNYVFVPLVTGRIEGYPLEDPKGTPWFYQSFGRVLVPPRATPESVVWTTDAGYLYVASSDPPRTRFRLETMSSFSAQPTYQSPLIYGVTMSGGVFAVDEHKAKVRWKYTTGFPSERAPAIVGEHLYVTSDEPMLHSVNAQTGLSEWEAQGISQFAAATKSHVYGVDRFGTIHVLDKQSGASLGRYPTGGKLTALVNDQTDRLYLMTDRGLVQCLHEIGATEPTYYVKPATEEEPKEEKTEPAKKESQVDQSKPTQPTGESKPEEPKTPDEENPFAAPSTTQNPFGLPTEQPPSPPSSASPFGADDENPFQ